MATLIALLISLLGYGTPSDFENYSEDQLQQEITILEEQNAASDDDGGLGNVWDNPSVQTPTNP